MIRLIACLCLLSAVTWAVDDFYCEYEVDKPCKKGHEEVADVFDCFNTDTFAQGKKCQESKTTESPGSSGSTGSSKDNNGNPGSSVSSSASKIEPDDEQDDVLDICNSDAKEQCEPYEAQTGTCRDPSCKSNPDTEAFDNCVLVYCKSSAALLGAAAVDKNDYDSETGEQKLKQVKIITDETAEAEALAQGRSFNAFAGLPKIDQYGRPRPDLCNLPKPFPRGCKPTAKEPYLRDAPHQIPYCQRIPCPMNPHVFGKTPEETCVLNPGCYFDKELNAYRRSLPKHAKLYPGVPVCHLAIRNSVFHAKTKLSPRWHPILTNCLINTFHKEIYQDKKLGCTMLPMLRAFGYHPKMAGWKDIQKNECILAANGCWEDGRGCYYEVKSNMFMVKSRQFASKNRRSRDDMYPYGRAKCQDFDTTNPRTIISSINKCLAAGCTVDKRVMNQYNDLYWYLGKTLPVYAHVAFNKAFTKGEITPRNVDEKIKAYVEAIPTQSDPNAYDPFNDPALMAMLGSSCGDRPCPPANFGMHGPPGKYLFPRQCPYRPIPFPLPAVPGLEHILKPWLQGPLLGCCDVPALCYFPKEEISLVNSGASSYVTRWSEWSECSKRCGGGMRYKTRACVTHFGGNCDESVTDQEDCNMHPCPYWSPWSTYGHCSRTCNGGQQERSRQCFPNNNPAECAGLDSYGSMSTRSCNNQPCVDRVGPFGPWDKDCKPCGTTRTRSRSCKAFTVPPCTPDELVEVQQCQYQCGKCGYLSNYYGKCQYHPNPYGGRVAGCYKTKTGTCSSSHCKPENCVSYKTCLSRNCIKPIG